MDDFVNSVKDALQEEFEETMESLDEAKSEVKSILADIADKVTPKILSSNESIREQGFANLRILNTRLAAIASIEASEALMRVKDAVQKGITIGLNIVLAAI